MSALENKEDDAAWERMEAELSRLRDLVREMREALEYYADFKSNTGHDGEYIVYLGCGRYQNDDGTRASEAIAKADAALKDSGEPVKYGCATTKRCGVTPGAPICRECAHWRPIK